MYLWIMSTYIVGLLGNCHKSDVCGLSALKFLNDLSRSYRLSEYGDAIGMDHWGRAARSKREKQLWSVKANALRSKKAKIRHKRDIEDLLDNLWYPPNEEAAEVAPSIYNMPLGVAMNEAPKCEFPSTFLPDKNEIITIDNKQYVLSEMSPSDANKLIDLDTKYKRSYLRLEQILFVHWLYILILPF